MMEIGLGQSIVLRPYGNARYYSGDAQMVKGIITGIGRKYFYVNLYGTVENPDRNPVKFDKKTLECHHDDCNAGYEVFESEEKLREAVEDEEIVRKIKRFMDYRANAMSHDVTRQIYDVLVTNGLVTQD